MTIRGNSPTAAMKKRGGIGSMRSGKPTARPKATGRTVYKSKTTIPTRRVAKPTAKKQKASSPSSLQMIDPDRNIIQNYLNKQRRALNKAAEKTKPKALQKLKPPTTQTPRQKAIAGAKARGQAKIAAARKKYNSLTPLQRASMAQTQRARATTGNPTSAQKEIIKNSYKKLGVKQLSAPQKQMPRTTSRVGSTAARRRAAAMARRRPTGRTVYNSRTTIPTRPTARRTAKPARGRVGQSLNRYMQSRRRFT